ncbi:MAG: hypothetical protein E6I88_10760 [Chloroflexi bacterium]|nr:MAG: hypothetical protein E6I88_10760 [Chloroflexota bacterium]
MGAPRARHGRDRLRKLPRAGDRARRTRRARTRDGAHDAAIHAHDDRRHGARRRRHGAAAGCRLGPRSAAALTLAPRRTSLWAAVTKYLVPNMCERVVRDASVVLSARSYLREGIGDGIFQKIARDIAITSIFEGTQLLQLSLITSQLTHLARAGRRDETVDVGLLSDLATPARSWNPSTTRVRVADPGGDELVERWFGQSAFALDLLASEPRAVAAVQSLRREAKALQLALATNALPGDLSLARQYCILHAAASCLQIWHTNRGRLSPESAGGEWLTLCLERLATMACCESPSPSWGGDGMGGDLGNRVFTWMLGQLERGELFSLMPLELAQ